MVWFASSDCFSRAPKSSSLKALHHGPLARPSLGALSRHGSATSHFAGTGAVERWYFGPTVQPPGRAQTASPARGEDCLVRFIFVFWPLLRGLAPELFWLGVCGRRVPLLRLSGRRPCGPRD